MQEMGNMANGGAIQGPLGLRLSAFHVGDIRIPLAAVAANRKSGIRIHPKSPEISKLRISNRKSFALFNLRFLRFPRLLIYGSAIKTPRNILKTCHIRI
jgi:hypothetical protein